jgi:hypothetical protein
VQVEIACVTYTCIWAGSGIDSLEINQISKMQLNRRFERRIEDREHHLSHPALNSTNVCCCFTLNQVTRTAQSYISQPQPSIGHPSYLSLSQ